LGPTNTMVRKYVIYNLLDSFLRVLSLGLFDNFFILLPLLSLGSLLSLHTKNDVSDLDVGLVVVVVTAHAERLQGLEGSLVLGSDLGEGQTGGGLLTNELSQKSLGSNDAVRNLLLSAKVWQPEDQFNWVDVGGNDDQLGLLLLDESGDVVETALDHEWLLLVNGLLLGLGLGFLDESLFLLLFVLRFVLLEEAGETLELVLGQSVGELVDDGRNLQSLEKDFLLSLE
jgi:hypothetical protein